ncbi:hypothetical protein [Bradyrhizobium sp. USDA 3364]
MKPSLTILVIPAVLALTMSNLPSTATSPMIDAVRLASPSCSVAQSQIEVPPRIGVGTRQHHAAEAARIVQHRQPAGAVAIGDVAGDRERHAVGVDRAADRRRVDLEIVAEGQVAQAIGLERGVVQRDRT